MVGAKEFSATKVWIAQIFNGKYVKEVEEEKQNHVLLNDGRKIYRANLVATIVGIDVEDDALVVDDGTGRIIIKNFGENDNFKNLSLGDVVLIIGKIREYGEKCILPEIIKKIEDKRWIEIRKKELGSFKEEKKIEEKKEITQNSEEIVEEVKENLTETILSVIRNLDEGNGADLDQVLLALSTTAAEKDIEKLLNEGEIFQTKPGRIKVLD